MCCNLRRFMPGATQQGFSMLEVLITLVIIAIALLGTAGLQLFAMRMGQSSQFLTQAIFLVSDMAERIESNKNAACDGNYALASATVPSIAATDCSAVECDGPTLASWDLSQWSNAIINLGLPQASWQITQTIAGNPSTYTIAIRWIDRSSVKSTTGESFSYTATRTISRPIL
jgi:type IV pilus assembly protein PilV